MSRIAHSHFRLWENETISHMEYVLSHLKTMWWPGSLLTGEDDYDDDDDGDYNGVDYDGDGGGDCKSEISITVSRIESFAEQWN